MRFAPIHAGSSTGGGHHTPAGAPGTAGSGSSTILGAAVTRWTYGWPAGAAAIVTMPGAVSGTSPRIVGVANGAIVGSPLSLAGPNDSRMFPDSLRR